MWMVQLYTMPVTAIKEYMSLFGRIYKYVFVCIIFHVTVVHNADFFRMLSQLEVAFSFSAKWRNHKNKIYYYISHNMHTQRQCNTLFIFLLLCSVLSSLTSSSSLAASILSSALRLLCVSTNGFVFLLLTHTHIFFFSFYFTNAKTHVYCTTYT